VFTTAMETITKKIKLEYFGFLKNTSDTVVCKRHWPENFSKIFVFGKPRPSNPPSIFSCIPKSLIHSQPNLPRTTKKVSCESRNAIPDEITKFNS